MVTLRPMTGDEFIAFLEVSIPEYASEKVKAGNWMPDEALEKSRKAHDELLPQGIATPGQHLYTIMDGPESAGRLWMSSDPAAIGGSGFIFDLFIDAAHRRRGIAEGAMRLLEGEARRMNIRRLSLHTFGSNTAARTLYEKLGYEITNINMARDIPEIPDAK